MKHKWVLDEYGKVDMWQFEYGDVHNGPHCEICGFSFCVHCNPEYMDSDDCPGKRPLVAAPRTTVKKIPPSINDESEPCLEFVETVGSGTGLPNDIVLRVLLWLRDHGYVGVKNLMVEMDYDPEMAGSSEIIKEAEVVE